jgi:hemerythrin-like domain-containing protein
MINVDNFRQQHREIMQVVSDISPRLVAERLKEDASGVRSMISALAGKLLVHLAMEDRSLYPTLTGSGDKAVVSLARAFMDEMGDLKVVFNDYLKKWPTAMAIQADVNAFISDTRGIFNALGRRVEREDKELYGMAERGE